MSRSYPTLAKNAFWPFPYQPPSRYASNACVLRLLMLIPLYLFAYYFCSKFVLLHWSVHVIFSLLHVFNNNLFILPCLVNAPSADLNGKWTRCFHDVRHLLILHLLCFCFIQSAIQEYFGSSTGQAVGVLLAGVLSALYVYKKYSNS